MPDTDTEVADLSKALAHPARLCSLRLLLGTPDCIGGDIVDTVGLARSTLSDHLRILKATSIISGITSGIISGSRTCYAMARAALGPLGELTGTLTPPSAAACCLLDEKDLS
jgi:ArsR family transcriptional regulator